MEPILEKELAFLPLGMEQINEVPSLTIRDWPEDDRPREKMLAKGIGVLTDAELIGILLRMGTKALSAVDLAKVILKAAGDDLNELAKLNVTDLQKIKGVGEAKAITIIAALELGRRRKASAMQERPHITSAADVYFLMMPHLLDQRYEQFWVLMMNNAGRVITKKMVSTGGVASTTVDPKVIFRHAFEANASGLIMVHNHPSGNKRPSKQDVILTEKVRQAGSHLDLPLLDHLIFTDQGYYSFADEDLL